MKRKFYYLLLVATTLLIVFGYGMYYYYTPPEGREPYPVAMTTDDTIRIAYIGDSWAFFHQPYDHEMSLSLSSKLQRPAIVTSLGYCGRSSKEIYWNLFDDHEMVNLLSQGCNCCFISAGINDANKKMSKNYYKQSMNCIIRFMLSNHITPILLEIPDYDIEKMYRWELPSRQILRRISRLVNGTPVDCRQEFRQALDDLIVENNYQDQVHIIRYKTWNTDFAKDQKYLYQDDGIHLNENGYAKLDSCIIEVCCNLKTNNAHGKD